MLASICSILALDYLDAKEAGHAHPDRANDRYWQAICGVPAGGSTGSMSAGSTICSAPPTSFRDFR
jgi:hypothetical protein